MRARQQLRAPNDVNGNPRRCWAILDRSGDGWAVADVIDEGYAGLPAQLRDLPELPPVNVAASEYRRWLGLAQR